MSSIKEQVLAQQGQYKESDDKYLSVLKQYNCDLNDEEVAAAVKKILDEKVAEKIWLSQQHDRSQLLTDQSHPGLPDGQTL